MGSDKTWLVLLIVSIAAWLILVLAAFLGPQMHSPNFWSAVGALGEWAGALGAFVAAGAAVYAADRAYRLSKQMHDDEERRRLVAASGAAIAIYAEIRVLKPLLVAMRDTAGMPPPGRASRLMELIDRVSYRGTVGVRDRPGDLDPGIHSMVAAMASSLDMLVGTRPTLVEVAKGIPVPGRALKLDEVARTAEDVLAQMDELSEALTTPQPA